MKAPIKKKDFWRHFSHLGAESQAAFLAACALCYLAKIGRQHVRILVGKKMSGPVFCTVIAGRNAAAERLRRTRLGPRKKGKTR